MLEQFKKMPKAEQQRLMKQYGLSPEMLKNTPGGQVEFETPEVVKPKRIERKEDSFELEEEPIPYSEEELKPFGYDLFAGEPTTFAPVSDVPVPSEYQMGPGDQVVIQLYGKENSQHDLTVSRSGNLQIPNLGPVNVIGLSFTEMKNKLANLIEQQYIGVQSSISLGGLRSIRIFVAGDAYKPGSYTVSSLSTITQALFVAGGINDIGSLRNIQLKRRGQLITTFDLYDLLMKGDASNDSRLQSGDVVFIPPVGATVSIKGQVRRPAIYELKGGETMAQLIRLAAGLKPNAYPAASIVERFDRSQLPTLVNVDLTTKQGKAAIAKSGDVLTVQSTAQRIYQQVAILGAVNRPGLYQWYKGIRINDLLKSTWRDLTNSADLDYALVVREINSQGDIRVIQVNIGQAMSNTKSASNIKLQPRDTLLIFNDQPMSLEREQLDLLIKQRIEEFTLKSFELEETPATATLFNAGFEFLTSDKKATETKLFDEIGHQELSLAATEIEQLLFKLFNEKQKLAISRSLTRQELLYPINQKLKSQGDHLSTVKLVSISGEVKFPGDYPLGENYNIAQLIDAAGGLKESAFMKRAELTRTNVNNADSSIVSHLDVNLTEQAQLASITLQSKDHLQVLSVPDWQKDMQVTLAGEVKFPGVYSIKNGETMMSVINRAGGFTENAFIEGAVFTRESVREQERQQIIKMADQIRRDIATRGLSQEGNFISFDDASKMLIELENLESIGRMVIDLPQLQANYTAKNLEQGLRLDDGDSLHVPSLKQIVTVVGEVHHASSHFFKEELGVEEYLTLAGGVKQRADDGRIYVIRADGSVFVPESSFWFDNQNQLNRGDTIVVPLDTEYKDNLTLWTQVTGIIYNSAVALAAIKGL
ncbi:sugar transporter [Alteromonadales bacterium alter-6D02]|nr:sugar transporter [Alteromonadales bacterium alter-6D02]